MKTALSILIPTYNFDCYALVNALVAQAQAIENLHFEVLVVEDGSTNTVTLAANNAITTLAHCTYWVRKENVGRAKIRNILARQAQYSWLLFIDSDMKMIKPDFLLTYLKTAEQHLVIYGGNSIAGDLGYTHNLKYKYEVNAEPHHTAEKRNQHPFQNFNTSNFLIEKKVILAHPFNENIKRYGYEDVLFGKQLAQNGITIFHIDNPVGFEVYESNPSFIHKIEEGLQTLQQFQTELKGYSHLLNQVEKLSKLRLTKLLYVLGKPFIPKLKQRLLQGNVPLVLLSLYKILYYLQLCQHTNKYNK